MKGGKVAWILETLEGAPYILFRAASLFPFGMGDWSQSPSHDQSLTKRLFQNTVVINGSSNPYSIEVTNHRESW